MRYLPIEKLNIGENVLETNLYSKAAEKEYLKGTIISKSLLGTLETEYQGIYVASADKNVDQVNYPLRQKGIKILNMMMGGNLLESTEDELYLCIDKIKLLAEGIICDCIIHSSAPLNISIPEIQGTYHIMHQVNTAFATVKIALALGFPKDKLPWLTIGALLSDTGKAFIPKFILNKKEKLSDDEFKIIKKHPEFSYQLLKRFSNLGEYVANITKNHHERIDGSGYPTGRKSLNISSQIVGLADAYTAMLSERDYAKAFSPMEVVRILRESGAFCPKLIECVSSLTMPFSLGSFVRLNSGEYGRITRESLSGCIEVYIYTDSKGNVCIPHCEDIKLDEIKENIINIRK